MLPEIIKTLLGQNTAAQFVGLYLMAIIGLAVSLLLHTTVRDPNSTNTPVAFSWSFFFRDNLKRIVLNVMVLFIAIRFYPDLFGAPINEFLAFGVGLGLDKIIELIKSKSGVLDADRSKLLNQK
jgi:hypothetical protein